MTLADDIVTYLAAATWTGITKPTLSTQHDKQAELKLGTGWVGSDTEELEPTILGSTSFGQRVTPFEIYIPCSTDANNVLYQAELETLIAAKSVTNGWWELTEFFHDELKNRHDFHCAGQQIRLA